MSMYTVEQLRRVLMLKVRAAALLSKNGIAVANPSYPMWFRPDEGYKRNHRSDWYGINEIDNWPYPNLVFWAEAEWMPDLPYSPLEKLAMEAE